MNGSPKYYVYSRNIISGREEFIGIYDTEKEAVHKIAFCYAVDYWSDGAKDNYYYFYKIH